MSATALGVAHRTGSAPGLQLCICHHVLERVEIVHGAEHAKECDICVEHTPSNQNTGRCRRHCAAARGAHLQDWGGRRP